MRNRHIYKWLDMTTKRMLINATQKEELRVALVSGQRLYDLDIEEKGKSQKKASIYKGKVTRVEPSLEAAFVDYGSGRHGFLPIKEVAKEYFQTKNFEKGRPSIKEALRPGQELIVQIDKEERGNKGAALTTMISLAGCYLVLMPNNPRAGGISRRIEGEERDELKSALNQLPIPKEMGLIIRTAGLGRSIEELKWDLEVLMSQWQAIQSVASNNSSPFLIHQDNDVIIRAIRDYLRPEIGEIIVDTEQTFEQVKNHLNMVRPDFVNRLKLHNGDTPLFTSFQIESQIESAYQREITLANGASIVIDPTEALVAIDINSAKATEGSDIEETALQTNLAAAAEIARQLRLRDMGGLIVIDFIDMLSSKHQRMVENKLKEEFTHDRARIQMGRLSRFGLLEMSRQRLRPALSDSSLIPCPRCSGHGTIRTTPSVALSLIRVIEEEVRKDRTARVHVQVPVEVASYLLNEKRKSLSKLETSYDVNIIIIPNKYLETPHYHLQWFKRDDVLQAKAKHSYQQVTDKPIDIIESSHVVPNATDTEPALKDFAPRTPAPTGITRRDEGIIKRIWSAVFGASSAKKDDESDSDNDGSGKSQSHRHHTGGKYQRGRKDNRKRHGHNRRQNRQDNRKPKRESDQHAAKQRSQGQDLDNQQSSNQSRQRRRPDQDNAASPAKDQKRTGGQRNQRSKAPTQKQAHEDKAIIEQAAVQSPQADVEKVPLQQPPRNKETRHSATESNAPQHDNLDRAKQNSALATGNTQPLEAEKAPSHSEEPQAVISQFAKAKVVEKAVPKTADKRFNQTSFTQLSEQQMASALVTLPESMKLSEQESAALSQVVTVKESQEVREALPKIQSTLLPSSAAKESAPIQQKQESELEMAVENKESQESS